MLSLVCVFISGCARYDYVPHGVHLARPAVAHRSKPATYIVRKGDTLYKIGRRFGIDFKSLAKKNYIRKPYTIYLGQRIHLKGVAPRTKAAVAPKALKKVKKWSASKNHIKLRWPVKGNVSSKFGPRGSRMHDGIDIAAKAGATVHVAAAGVVVYADARLTGYGNLVIVRHSSDLFTAYAHNQSNVVKRGDKVVAGQRIAYVGSTGRSTGPHLHFEVRRGETAVDPLAYLPKR